MSSTIETTIIAGMYSLLEDNSMEIFEGSSVPIDTPEKDGIDPDVNDDTSAPNSIPKGLCNAQVWSNM